MSTRKKRRLERNNNAHISAGLPPKNENELSHENHQKNEIINEGIDVKTKPIEKEILLETVKKQRNGRGKGRKKNMIAYTVYLPQDLIDFYNNLSEVEERTTAEMVRIALKSYRDHLNVLAVEN